MRPLIATVFVLAALSPAMSQGVPTIKFEASCRASAVGVGAGPREDIESCRRSELAARDLLVQQWNDFDSADRGSCHRLTTTGTPGTYTELLTCLEMKRAARQLPDSPATVGRGSAPR